MTDTTKYQLCLDYFKLILKVKAVAGEESYTRIVDEAVSKFKNKDIAEEDMSMLKNFLMNLNEENFYDNCMNVFLQLKKYDKEDTKIFPNIEFLKLQLYNFVLDKELT